MDIFWGLMIPFLGTTLGAACVFLLKNEINVLVRKALLGFASGVMIAASVWSLLIPAMDMSKSMGKFAFVPAASGLLIGICFLLFMDHSIPHLHLNSDSPEGPEKNLSRNTMLILAVTLHNIPEGMAVGVVFAGVIEGSSGMTMAGALTLAIGIAIQNFPEGAIISMPLRSENGMSHKKAFLYGMGSGAVEPIAAVITIAMTHFISPVLPYILAFAAGAMIYVVVEELIPEASQGKHSNIATIGFALGFIVMMTLDVTLG